MNECIKMYVGFVKGDMTGQSMYKKRTKRDTKKRGLCRRNMEMNATPTDG